MRVTLIVNPAAGTAQDRAPIEEAQALLRSAGHVVSLHETAGQGDAERLAASAVGSGAELVGAAGGDGTLNEVVNGLAGVEGGLTACALAVLPAGTGNDFARTLGLESPEAAIAALGAGQTRAIDLVRLGGRVFLNASAGGFTAETSAQVTSGMKQAVGALAYLIGGARAFLEYEPVGVLLESAERRLETELQLFAVCNGGYIGGGHQLAPSARPDDGAFEVCLVRASSTLDFLTLLPRLSTGDHLDDEDVTYFRSDQVTLTFERAIKVNTDGEVLEVSRCQYVMNPAAVRFVAPATRVAPSRGVRR